MNSLVVENKQVLNKKSCVLKLQMLKSDTYTVIYSYSYLSCIIILVSTLICLKACQESVLNTLTI